MTITSDIEKDTKANFAVAEVVESDSPAVATAAVPAQKTAVPVQSSVLELATAAGTEDDDKRKTELCCGSCCDYKKACVIVNIVYIILSILAIILPIMGVSILNSVTAEDFDDDYVVQNWEDVEDMRDDLNEWFGLAIAHVVVSTLFGILGIVGANKYNKGMVLATGVWYLIDVVLGFFFSFLGGWLGAVMRALFAYPHIGLFVAIKKGFITAQTYEREQYCCCGGGSPK